jgi:ABC-type branched-subunit amino acid transport system substrate-binding protein
VALSAVSASCLGSTQPVVKIGLIAPFEELYRADGYAALHAVRLAVAQRNAAGGIGGRPVALVALNDSGRAHEAAWQARKLALDRDVMGVVGPLQLATARAAGQEFARQDVPWIAPLSLEAAERPGGFALSAPPELVGQQGIVALARHALAGPITVVSDQPSAVAGALAQAASLGISAAPLAPQEFSSAQVTSGGALWLGDTEGGARAADRVSAAGAAAMVGGPEIGSSVFPGRTTDPVDVSWLSSGLPIERLPEDFVAAYQSLAGALPTPQAGLVYDSANMLLDAMARAAGQDGRLDRPGVARALADLGTAGWRGLAGEITWNGDGCPGRQPCGVWQNAPVYEFPVQP